MLWNAKNLGWHVSLEELVLVLCPFLPMHTDLQGGTQAWVGQESPVTNDLAIGQHNNPQRITGKKKGQVHSIYSHNFTSCAHSVEIMKTNFWVSLLFLRLLSVSDSSRLVLARTKCYVGRAGTAGKLLAFRFKKCQCNYFLNAAIIRNAFKCCLQTVNNYSVSN